MSFFEVINELCRLIAAGIVTDVDIDVLLKFGDQEGYLWHRLLKETYRHGLKSLFHRLCCRVAPGWNICDMQRVLRLIRDDTDALLTFRLVPLPPADVAVCDLTWQRRVWYTRHTALPVPGRFAWNAVAPHVEVFPDEIWSQILSYAPPVAVKRLSRSLYSWVRNRYPQAGEVTTDRWQEALVTGNDLLLEYLFSETTTVNACDQWEDYGWIWQLMLEHVTSIRLLDIGWRYCKRIVNKDWLLYVTYHLDHAPLYFYYLYSYLLPRLAEPDGVHEFLRRFDENNAGETDLKAIDFDMLPPASAALFREITTEKQLTVVRHPLDARGPVCSITYEE